MSDERKELGKIKKFEYGLGGYQDVMAGFKIELGGSAWGVQDFWTAGETERVKALLTGTGRMNITQLIGLPVEVTFHKFNVLKTWRVLTEVL